MVVTSRQGLHWIWNYRKPRSHVQASLKPSFGYLGTACNRCSVLKVSWKREQHFFAGMQTVERNLQDIIKQKIYEHIISLCLYNSFMMLVSAGSVSGIGICQQNPKNCSWIFNLRYEYYLDTIPITLPSAVQRPMDSKHSAPHGRRHWWVTRWSPRAYGADVAGAPLKIDENRPKGCWFPTIHFQVLLLLVSGRVLLNPFRQTDGNMKWLHITWQVFCSSWMNWINCVLELASTKTEGLKICM